MAKAKNEIVLSKSLEKQLASIDKHLAKYAIPTKRGRIAAATITPLSLCGFYMKARPIILLLGQVIGKTAGAIIISLVDGLDAYCALGYSPNPSPSDAKTLSKAIAKICPIWTKVKPFVALAVMLFAGRSEWIKALTGLQASLDSLCSTPTV